MSGYLVSNVDFVFEVRLFVTGMQSFLIRETWPLNIMYIISHISKSVCKLVDPTISNFSAVILSYLLGV